MLRRQILSDERLPGCPVSASPASAWCPPTRWRWSCCAVLYCTVLYCLYCTVKVELLCAATAEPEAVTLGWRLEDRAGGSSVTEATCVCHVDTARVTQTLTVTLTDQGPGMVHSC